jgi:hypothetical protein
VVSSDCPTSSSKCLLFKRHSVNENTKLRIPSIPKAHIFQHWVLSLKSAPVFFYSQETVRLPEMSYSSRPLPSHLRQASTAGNSAQAGQSPILLARINEKKAELENLKQLRDLSAGLAGQMQMLEEKLATLSDGTEGELLHGQKRGTNADKITSSCCYGFRKLA